MNRIAALALAVLATAAALGTSAATPTKGDPEQIARGRYLVTLGGCNDCHTPWKATPEGGMAPDESRMLSGHPEGLTMPAAPSLDGPWGYATSTTMTAVSGPWGVSFARNLTPDPETGLGAWTEENFILTLRNGRHMGQGRPLLPPMPWFNYGKATDADLKAIFAYLRSIPAVKNRVPEPWAPTPATAAK
jgi:mono/diheme cytochrome c family protein